MRSLIGTLVVVLLSFQETASVTCYVGYGQRNSYLDINTLWTRRCEDTDYCYEMRTSDYSTMVRLMGTEVFEWDSEYEEFYVRECGGSYDMETLSHGCEIGEKNMVSDTGQEELMYIGFCCTGDYCCTTEDVEAEICGTRLRSSLAFPFVILIWTLSFFKTLVVTD